jgi:uncharacterized membrane protein
MAFIDILALQEVTLLLAAVIVAYVGAVSFWAMYTNNAAGLKSALKAAAVPIGVVGATATIFGVWGEMVWQYPAPYLTQYNIFFNDIYLLFGLTLLVLAVSMGLSLKLQYAGLFGLVAGGVTISYAWNGYVLGLTKDPLETFLLFCGFGLAGILSFPATVMADHFAAHPDGTAFGVPTSVAASTVRRTISFQSSSRAAQPIAPVGPTAAPEADVIVPVKFQLPAWVTVSLIVFIVSVALAAFAALAYLDSTMPAHLAAPP